MAGITLCHGTAHRPGETRASESFSPQGKRRVSAGGRRWPREAQTQRRLSVFLLAGQEFGVDSILENQFNMIYFTDKLKEKNRVTLSIGKKDFKKM